MSKIFGTGFQGVCTESDKGKYFDEIQDEEGVSREVTEHMSKEWFKRWRGRIVDSPLEYRNHTISVASYGREEGLRSI